MIVGITGQQGFIGYHLSQLITHKYKDSSLLPFDDSLFDNQQHFNEYIAQCDVIVHLAGVNRDPNPQVVFDKNIELTDKLIIALEASDKKPHVIFSSSSQETLDNPYGKAKKQAREQLENWATKSGSSFTGLIIPNVFGPFGKPFYNSFIATFCHQLTHNQQPEVKVDSEVNLIYVCNLVEYIVNAFSAKEGSVTSQIVPFDIRAKVTEVLAKLNEFNNLYVSNCIVPQFKNSFEVNLFNTFRSYIEPSDRKVTLKPNTDNRGSLYEAIKAETGGQMFYSTTKSGITRGNHFHFNKVERFCVISGKGNIKLRKLGTNEVLEYIIDGTQPAYVDMPVLYTHNITNIGDTELITLFWSNEIFNPEKPDTYFEMV
jgi:UDP-2-acetamido-2,6-beta-L-arabino-hexul-4-ose reductase